MFDKLPELSFNSPVAKMERVIPATEEDALRAAIASATEERDKLAASIKTDNDAIKTIVAQIAEIRKAAEAQMLMLNEKRVEIEERVFEVKRAIRAADKEIANLERQLRLLLERMARSDVFQLKAQSFDSITAGFKWREFAMDHQLTGAKILAVNQRCILGDKMGLGKTLTSIIAIDMLQAKRVLIVAPSDVVKNFQREVDNWAPHRMTVPFYKLPEAQRNALLSLLTTTMAPCTLLINYEAWRKDKSLIDKLVQLRFDTIILDEAHSVKNTSSSAYQGVREIVMSANCCPLCSGGVDWHNTGGFANVERCRECDWASDRKDIKWEAEDRRSIKNVFPMSGTPILNRPQELFPLLHLILPMVFHNERVFLDLYCEQDLYTGYWRFRNGGMESMTAHLAGRYVARDRKTAGVVLPKQHIVVHEIEMDDELYPLQAKYMRQLTKYSQIILDNGKQMTALAAITLILRKRQMNVWPGGIKLKDADGYEIFSVGDEVNESIKVDKAMGIIEDAGDQRSLLFSQFKPALYEIQRRLERLGISAVVFDGETKEDIREAIKKDFDRKYASDSYRWQVVLCNYKTGGVGLNFTAATNVVTLDEEWNGGKADQAYARTDRIGQTEEQTVHILRLMGTIDTWMADLNDFKRAIVAGFDAGGAELTAELMEAIKRGEI